MGYVVAVLRLFLFGLIISLVCNFPCFVQSPLFRGEQSNLSLQFLCLILCLLQLVEELVAVDDGFAYLRKYGLQDIQAQCGGFLL